MDFIDPKKRRANKIKLLVGYVLITCALVMTTLVLLYQANGYTFGKNGQLIQKGLVFISSQPSPASIYLNGALNKAATNARLDLPAGQYTVRLTRSGYRTWQRAIGVEGGSVEHFDYPLLVPQKLITTNVQTYAAQPKLVLQSPDRRWLLVQRPGSSLAFDEYDVTTAKQLQPTTVSLPDSLAPTAAGGSWQLVDWSTDNLHVLLDYVANGVNDYIVFDRQAPSQSVDLTKSLKLNNSTEPLFDNNHYDQYFLFDTATHTLATATLSNTQAVDLVQHVLAYKAYGGNVILYATDYQAPAGSVDVRLLQGSTTYTLRQLRAGAATYLLNLTQYNGDWYMVAGDSSEDKTYVYKDPQSVLSSQPVVPLVPVAILKVDNPTFEAFSANAQFVVAENGSDFSVFDAQNQKIYTYQTAAPVPAGQHATWMDGDRLTYVSGGKAIMLDYDNANVQTLQFAVDSTTNYFDQKYQWMYAVAPNTGADAAQNPFALTQTSLLIPSDQ